MSFNRPFIGKSGKLLRLTLEKAGLDPEQAFFTNAMRCMPPAEKVGAGYAAKTNQYRKGIEACRERLAEEVLAHPRRLILTFGNSANRALLGDFNFKITGKRGKPIDLGDIGVVLPTFHPASILRNQGEYPRWAEDIRYAARLFNGGSAAIKRPPKPTAHIMLLEPGEEAYYPHPATAAHKQLGVAGEKKRSWDKTIADGSDLADWPTRKVYTGIPAAVRVINELLQKPLLAADIETGYSYSPRVGKVLCLAVSWSATEGVVFSEGLMNSKGFRPHLVRLLTEPGPMWIGHNMKFDVGFLLHRIIIDGQTKNSRSRGSRTGLEEVLRQSGEESGRSSFAVSQEQRALSRHSPQISAKSARSSQDERTLSSGTRNGTHHRSGVAGAVQETGESLRPLRKNVEKVSNTQPLGNGSQLEDGGDQRNSLSQMQHGSRPIVRRSGFGRDSFELPETGIVANYEDTMLLHYCLDETKGTHDLEQVSRDLLGATDYKQRVRRYANNAIAAKNQVADLGYENVPREMLYQYCLLDTAHTFSIYEILSPKVRSSKGLTKLYEKLLLPASRFLRRVQDYGLHVDTDFVDELDVILGKKVEDARAAVKRETSRKAKLYPLGKTHKENERDGPTEYGPIWDNDVFEQSTWATKKKPDGFNARNWRHTAFVLYRLIGWVPMNVNERTLRDLDQTGKDQSATFGYKAKNYARGHPNRKQVLNFPFIQALIDLRLSAHAYGMMVTGIRKYTEPDGRLHTIFNLQATETGRLSSSSPNLQNLPVPEKDDPTPYRNIVGAPPGRVIIEADYSQVELRLLAHFSNDPTLIQVYKDGRDLHTELSIAIWGDRVFDPVTGVQIAGYTNYQRVRAKAVNFGIAYGRGAGSIAAEHDIPERDAEIMRQEWFSHFEKAAAWLEELRQAPLNGRTIVSKFGRRRRFGVVSRDNLNGLSNQSTNFPMQSHGTDLTLLSAMRVQQKWDREGTDAHIICLVHDALVAECDGSIGAKVAQELKDIMEETPMMILHPVIDFPVDAHMGTSWGTMKTEEMTDTKTTVAGQEGTFGKAGISSSKL